MSKRFSINYNSRMYTVWPGGRMEYRASYDA